MTNLENKIFNHIKPIIETLGYELVDVKNINTPNNNTIKVIIFKKGDMSLADCEAVHNAIDKPLDNLNPTNDKAYTLEVSSMGLDWPIKTDNDFRRRLGEEIEIKLYKKIDGEKHYIGKLLNYNSDDVTLLAQVGKCGNLKTKEIKIERKAISKAVPYIKF